MKDLMTTSFKGFAKHKEGKALWQWTMPSCGRNKWKRKFSVVICHCLLSGTKIDHSVSMTKLFTDCLAFGFLMHFFLFDFHSFLLLHLTGQLVLCLCSSLFYSEIIRCYKSMCSQCLRSNHVAKQKSITAVGSTYSSSPFQKNRKWKHYLQQLISPTTW